MNLKKVQQEARTAVGFFRMKPCYKKLIKMAAKEKTKELKRAVSEAELVDAIFEAYFKHIGILK